MVNKYRLVLEQVLEKSNDLTATKVAKIINLETGEEKYIVNEIMEVFFDYVSALQEKLDAYKRIGTVDEIQNVVNSYFLNKPAFDEYVKLFGDIETARKLYAEEADYPEKLTVGEINQEPVAEEVTETTESTEIAENKEDTTTEEKPVKKGLI